jgi:hypothetical protein
MSAHEGLPPHAATTHDGARVHCIERILDRYGVLSHDRLYDLAGAASWAGGPSFDSTLHSAVASGRVRALGDVLFASAQHSPGAAGPAA